MRHPVRLRRPESRPDGDRLQRRQGDQQLVIVDGFVDPAVALRILGEGVQRFRMVRLFRKQRLEILIGRGGLRGVFALDRRQAAGDPHVNARGFYFCVEQIGSLRQTFFGIVQKLFRHVDELPRARQTQTGVDLRGRLEARTPPSGGLAKIIRRRPDLVFGQLPIPDLREQRLVNFQGQRRLRIFFRHSPQVVGRVRFIRGVLKIGVPRLRDAGSILAERLGVGRKQPRRHRGRHIRNQQVPPDEAVAERPAEVERRMLDLSIRIGELRLQMNLIAVDLDFLAGDFAQRRLVGDIGHRPGAVFAGGEAKQPERPAGPLDRGRQQPRPFEGVNAFEHREGRLRQRRNAGRLAVGIHGDGAVFIGRRICRRRRTLATNRGDGRGPKPNHQPSTRHDTP